MYNLYTYILNILVGGAKSAKSLVIARFLAKLSITDLHSTITDLHYKYNGFTLSRQYYNYNFILIYSYSCDKVVYEM